MDRKIRCRNCKREVSDSLSVCPHCNQEVHTCAHCESKGTYLINAQLGWVCRDCLTEIKSLDKVVGKESKDAINRKPDDADEYYRLNLDSFLPHAFLELDKDLRKKAIAFAWGDKDIREIEIDKTINFEKPNPPGEPCKPTKPQVPKKPELFKIQNWFGWSILFIIFGVYIFIDTLYSSPQKFAYLDEDYKIKVEEVGGPVSRAFSALLFGCFFGCIGIALAKGGISRMEKNRKEKLSFKLQMKSYEEGTAVFERDIELFNKRVVEYEREIELFNARMEEFSREIDKQTIIAKAFNLHLKKLAIDYMQNQLKKWLAEMGQICEKKALQEAQVNPENKFTLFSHETLKNNGLIGVTYIFFNGYISVTSGIIFNIKAASYTLDINDTPMYFINSSDEWSTQEFYYQDVIEFDYETCEPKQLTKTTDEEYPIEGYLKCSLIDGAKKKYPATKNEARNFIDVARIKVRAAKELKNQKFSPRPV